VTANKLFTPKYKTDPEIWCNSPKEEGQRPISNMTNKSNDRKSNKSYQTRTKRENSTGKGSGLGYYKDIQPESAKVEYTHLK